MRSTCARSNPHQGWLGVAAALRSLLIYEGARARAVWSRNRRANGDDDDASLIFLTCCSDGVCKHPEKRMFREKMCVYVPLRVAYDGAAAGCVKPRTKSWRSLKDARDDRRRGQFYYYVQKAKTANIIHIHHHCWRWVGFGGTREIECSIIFFLFFVRALVKHAILRRTDGMIVVAAVWCSGVRVESNTHLIELPIILL